jgi:ribose transport system ATP-binding protein
VIGGEQSAIANRKSEIAGSENSIRRQQVLQLKTSRKVKSDPQIPPGASLLECADLEKRFFGVSVLKKVGFSLGTGLTLGIVGENGAGKSTLMNLLGGNLRPDGGVMTLQGQPYRPASPRAAAARGIAFIHQELNLFSNLTIAENIHLTSFPRKRSYLPWIHRRALRERTRRWLQEVDLARAPDTPVESLSAGERQLVEIAKALSLEAKIVIFDEPTTSLTAPEAERLFGIMERLRARGIAMIYISHNLGDVLRLSQEILVLRDGEMVATGPRDGFDVDKLVALMVGREIEQFFPARARRPSAEVVLEACHLSQPGVARGVSFQLRRGEVLGLSGLMGSGRSELARILFGVEPYSEGEIRLRGQSLGRCSPRQRIQRGLAFLTEDRRSEGLCLEASIADNIALVSLPAYVRTPARIIERTKLARRIAVMRAQVKLTPAARDEQPAKILSGGNQQKVVLAKWLLREPEVFILDEPTRGIDVGAKCEIYRLINQLVEKGAGVLMISSEIEELIGMCDRILVMNRGAILDEIPGGQFDRERILRAAFGGSGPGARSRGSESRI